MIPEKAQGKVNEGTVVAAGPGARGKVSLDSLARKCQPTCSVPHILQEGELQPLGVKVGDKVLVPEYGGTKLTFDDKASLNWLTMLFELTTHTFAGLPSIQRRGHPWNTGKLNAICACICV